MLQQHCGNILPEALYFGKGASSLLKKKQYKSLDAALTVNLENTFFSIDGVIVIFGQRGLIAIACLYRCIDEPGLSESKLLLVPRPNDNHSLGPVIREVSP